MKVFLDTSALAKRYVEEPGSNELEDLLFNHVKEVVISTLALPELAAALARKVRERDINEDSAVSVLQEAETDWTGLFGKIDLDQELALTAAQLTLQHPLKGADAVHLASALSAEADLFVTSDRNLLGIAGNIGLRAYDPSSGVLEEE